MDIIEHAEVLKFIENLQDEKMKKLLNKMRFDYDRYVAVGTVEECTLYKQYCEIPMKDFIKSAIHKINTLKRENKELTENYKNQIKAWKEVTNHD